MFEGKEWFQDDDFAEDDNIYESEARGVLLDNDELTAREAAFVDGYEEDFIEEEAKEEVPEA